MSVLLCKECTDNLSKDYEVLSVGITDTRVCDKCGAVIRGFEDPYYFIKDDNCLFNELPESNKITLEQLKKIREQLDNVKFQPVVLEGKYYKPSVWCDFDIYIRILRYHDISEWKIFWIKVEHFIQGLHPKFWFKDND